MPKPNTLKNEQNNANTTTVFYDHTCQICLSAVSFSKKKSSANCTYKPLSSSEGKAALQKYTKKHKQIKNAVLLKKNDEIIGESDVIFYLLKKMPAPYKYLAYFSFLPKSLLNTIYRFIAKNRKLLWNKKKKT